MMKSKKVRAIAACLTVNMLFSMTGCSSKNNQVATEESLNVQEQELSETLESISPDKEASVAETFPAEAVTEADKLEAAEENHQTESVVANTEIAHDNKNDKKITSDVKTTNTVSAEDPIGKSDFSVDEGNDLTSNSMPTSKVNREDNSTDSLNAPATSKSMSENSNTSLPQNTPASETMDDAEVDDEVAEISAMDGEDDSLNSTQKNAINMLNYMTVLTQEINASKQSRMFLDEAYDSIINNIYPNSVDSKTQSQIDSILDTLHQYQMLTVKRERLEYLYEQNQAQALRQAIPNPIGLLSVVQSGSLLKTAASVLYMGIDSVTSYKSASAQADLQYLKDGWELDDAEAEKIHESRTTAFNYMLKMVNDNNLPGDYALSENAVEEFVSWKNKTNLVSKIQWLESNQTTYEKFGPYWLELAKDYYDSENYEGCLKAFDEYENVTTRIFRKDTDYGDALPMAILSAKETMSRAKYNEYADKYAAVVLKNTDDWTVRYFIAQVYIDLYKSTKNKEYLDKAYKIALDNVNELVDEQKNLNVTYLADVKEEKAEAGATKQQKKDVKQYNKMLKANRKIELPPVSEALYLNCDLLFALIDERETTSADKKVIDGILHENGDSIFLTTALDERFRFDESNSAFDANDLNVLFDGKTISVPATCVSDRSTIEIVVFGKNGETTIGDWTVKQVERPKNANYSEFVVSFTSETAKKYEYFEGDSVNVKIVPVAESPDEVLEISFEAVPEKKLFVFDGLNFERK